MEKRLIPSKWISYSELAWTEPILAPPESYEEETELYCSIIQKDSKIKPKTLLHLGCGAGGMDAVFKRHFKTTGVDISQNMIDIAKNINPEVVYFHGDMRTCRLGQSFDAVAIPDSIAYMANKKDLRDAIATSYDHLNPGGVLLIVAHTKEEFRENNFLYTGSQKDIEITVFENNYVMGPGQNTYEATILYLIRRKGRLNLFCDKHILGLFPLRLWLGVFAESGLEVRQTGMDHLYDPFILAEGQYPLTVFSCCRPLGP